MVVAKPSVVTSGSFEIFRPTRSHRADDIRHVVHTWKFPTTYSKTVKLDVAMPSYIDLGSHALLKNARYTITLSGGKDLVLFRLPSITTKTPKSCDVNGWTYYAMEAVCPHAGGPMESAHTDIEDSSYIASCPWHAYDFNLETGKSSYGISACVFPIKIVDGNAILETPEDDITLQALAPVSEKVKYKHGTRPAETHELVEKTTEQLSQMSLQPPSNDSSMSEWCTSILNTTDPELKIERTTRLFSIFATRESTDSPMPLGAGSFPPPDEPPRQALQEVKPWEMPNPGRGGTVKSRTLMLHALANIEQWAIDLAIDICVRFATFQTQAIDGREAISLPRTFYHDWLKVANDEAKHFSLLRTRLEELGSFFGAFPVHHGLWESATLTKDDLRARISVIALVHEARGLDINPMTIEKFRKAKDFESVEALNIIHRDEITHVTTGHRWLTWICEQEGTDPVKVFRANVERHFKGAVKGPFNAEARQQAGMDSSYYENLSGLPARGHVIAGG